MTFPIHNPIRAREAYHADDPVDVQRGAAAFANWMYEDFGGTMQPAAAVWPKSEDGNIPSLYLDALEKLLGQRVKALLKQLEELAPGRYERMDLTARKIYKRNRDRKEIIGEIVRKQQCWQAAVRNVEIDELRADDIVVVQPGDMRKLMRVYTGRSYGRSRLSRLSDRALKAVSGHVTSFYVGDNDLDLRKDRLFMQFKRRRDYRAQFEDLGRQERALMQAMLNADELGMKLRSWVQGGVATRKDSRGWRRSTGKYRLDGTLLRKGGSWRHRYIPWPISVRPFSSAYDDMDLVLRPRWDVMLAQLEESILPFAELPPQQLVIELPRGRKVVALRPNDLKAEGNAQGNCVNMYKREVQAGQKLVFSVRKQDGRPAMTFSFATSDDDGVVALERDEYKGSGNRLAGIKDTPEGAKYEPWEIAEAIAATIAAARWVEANKERAFSKYEGYRDMLPVEPDLNEVVSRDIYGMRGAIQYLPAEMTPALRDAAEEYEAIVPGTSDMARFLTHGWTRRARQNPGDDVPPYRIMGRRIDVEDDEEWD